MYKCPCNGELEYKFDKEKGQYLMCSSCGTKFGINPNQTPKIKDIKMKAKSLTNYHKRRIREINSRVEAYEVMQK